MRYVQQLVDCMTGVTQIAARLLRQHIELGEEVEAVANAMQPSPTPGPSNSVINDDKEATCLYIFSCVLKCGPNCQPRQAWERGGGGDQPEQSSMCQP